MMTVRRHTGSGGECLARTAATERPFRRGMDGTPDAVDAAITAALCAGVRRVGLLSVMGFPVSLRPRLVEFAVAD
jgi:hypothetical protein